VAVVGWIGVKPDRPRAALAPHPIILFNLLLSTQAAYAIR
jgi:uncharacterized membrane protein